MNDSNPRRRHRAAYLAPARAQPELLGDVDMAEIGFPLPVTRGINVMQQQQQHQDDDSPDFEKYSFPKMLSTLSLHLIDCLVFSMALVMSFFLYDVEITMVKPPLHQRISPPFIRRHSNVVAGSRIVWLNMDIDGGDALPPTSATTAATRATMTTTTTTTTTTTRRGFQESVV